MTRFFVCCILLLTLSLMLAACGAVALGPVTWLDRPLDGARLPLAPLTIQAHASDADGVTSFQFFVDDAPLVTTPADGERLGQATVEWTPTEPGVYTIRARGIDAQGNVGSEATSVVTIGELQQASPTVAAEPDSGQILFIVDPDEVPAGGCAVLRWQVNPPSEALLDGEGVPPEGEREVCVEATTTYELLVPDTGQTQTATLEVESETEPASPAPDETRITFTADRTELEPGECTTLRWSVEGGLAVSLDAQPVDPSGQAEVCPEESTTYRLTVDIGQTMEQREIVIAVSSQPQPSPMPTPTRLPVPSAQPSPTAPGVAPTPPPGCPGAPVFSFFTANPSTITAGQSSTLSWGAVTNGNSNVLVGSVVINPGLGEVGSPGSRVVSPGSTTTYTMVATGCGGTAQKQVTVVVNPSAFSADLAVTDLYADSLPQGTVYARITNNGPSAVNKVNVQLSCQGDGYRRGLKMTTVSGDVYVAMNLSAGQTGTFNTGVSVDTQQLDYYMMTCSIQVPFNEPNTNNNSHTERIPPQD
jgi:hypothetical protein